VTDPRTLNELYFGMLDRYGPDTVAMRHRVGGEWTDITYRQLAERVRHVSLGLESLGVQPGERVAILSHNRPEWAITDLACLAARCTDVPIYPTLPAHQVAYILRDSGSRVVCCSTAGQLEKVLEVRGELPGLEHVVVFDELPSHPGVHTFSGLERRGTAGPTTP